MNENEKDYCSVSFRCPQSLVSALEKAAAEEWAPVSHVIRLAVRKELRGRGLMEPAVA